MVGTEDAFFSQTWHTTAIPFYAEIRRTLAHIDGPAAFSVVVDDVRQTAQLSHSIPCAVFARGGFGRMEDGVCFIICFWIVITF